MQDRLLQVYELLLGHFGPRHWWPADSPFEVAIGAILTQNTAWGNVEKAIHNLKQAGKLNPPALGETATQQLQVLIEPSGFYRQKARYLQSFVAFLAHEYNGDISNLRAVHTHRLREQLLAVRGLGRETVDSILLYALERPVFVVDAYTRRIASRLGLVPDAASESYAELQEFFEAHLPHSAELFNEYHALLVSLGKQFCRKRPQCEGCPVSCVCLHNVPRAR